MSQRGRPPKAHRLKVIEGDRGKRGLTPPPKATPKKPRRPSDLSDGATRVWNRVVPMLDDLGILTPLDGLMLTLFCEHFAASLAAARDVSNKGTLIAGRRQGEPRKNPAHTPMLQHSKMAASIGAAFGLTPADRLRLAVYLEAAGDDNLETILAAEWPR